MLFKRCFKCGAEKPLQDFYRHAAMADGHLNKCKSCAKDDAKSHRDANIDFVRAYDRERARRPERIARAKRTIAGWQAAHPKRRAAQHAVGNAVQSGRLIPWPACALPDCDRTDVEAHHPDYDAPLDVVWLCPPHHKQAHALSRKSAGDR